MNNLHPQDPRREDRKPLSSTPQCPIWCRHSRKADVHPAFVDHVDPDLSIGWLHADAPTYVGAWRIELTAETFDDDTDVQGVQVAIIDETAGTAVDIDLEAAHGIALAVAAAALAAAPKVA